MAWTLTPKFVFPADWGASVGTTPVRRVRLQVVGSSSDATEMTATSILDISTLTGLDGDAATKVSIETVQYAVSGVTYIDLKWDRTTDLVALRMPPGASLVMYDPPLRDTGTGDTGDLVLASSGASATGAFTLDLLLRVHS